MKVNQPSQLGGVGNSNNNLPQTPGRFTFNGGFYTIKEVLGQGAFATTYKVQSSNGKVFALKALQLSPKGSEERAHEVAELTEEGQILKVLSDSTLPAFPQYERLLFNTKDGTAAFQLEYVPGHNLETKITTQKPLPETELKKLIGSIGAALAYMHRLPLSLRESLTEGHNKLLHMDIKPANIIATGDPKRPYVLIDYGSAESIRHRQVDTKAHTKKLPKNRYGTPPYADPVFAWGGKALPTSDVYSFAATLLHLSTPQLLSGIENQPYDQNQRPILAELVDKTNLSRKLKALLKRSLSINPTERPTDMREFLDLIPTASNEYYTITADGKVTLGEGWESLLPKEGQEALLELIKVSYQPASSISEYNDYRKAYDEVEKNLTLLTFIIKTPSQKKFIQEVCTRILHDIDVSKITDYATVKKILSYHRRDLLNPLLELLHKNSHGFVSEFALACAFVRSDTQDGYSLVCDSAVRDPHLFQQLADPLVTTHERDIMLNFFIDNELSLSRYLYLNENKKLLSPPPFVSLLEQDRSFATNDVAIRYVFNQLEFEFENNNYLPDNWEMGKKNLWELLDSLEIRSFFADDQERTLISGTILKLIPKLESLCEKIGFYVEGKVQINRLMPQLMEAPLFRNNPEYMTLLVEGITASERLREHINIPDIGSRFVKRLHDLATKIEDAEKNSKVLDPTSIVEGVARIAFYAKTFSKEEQKEVQSLKQFFYAYLPEVVKADTKLAQQYGQAISLLFS